MARAAGNAAELPRKMPKPERPTRRGIAFWTLSPDGEVLLQRRAEKGLLGGMMEIPSTEWRPEGCDPAEAQRQAPAASDWTALPGEVRHTFTHFHLELEVWAARLDHQAAALECGDRRWVALDDLGNEALPSVMRKVVKHALKAAADLEGPL